jgi:hypothetical protein
MFALRTLLAPSLALGRRRISVTPIGLIPPPGEDGIDKRGLDVSDEERLG